MIAIKRIYDPPSPDDGYRVLVDRLWPRGVTRSAASVAHWAKDLAPSPELRKWFSGDTGTWLEFQCRYRIELAAPAKAVALAELVDRANIGTVTLLFAKRDPVENSATVLRDVIAKQIGR